MTKLILYLSSFIGISAIYGGIFAKLIPLAVGGGALMLGGVVFYSIFYKCPHCGAFLGRKSGEFCHHCGGKLDGDGE